APPDPPRRRPARHLPGRPRGRPGAGRAAPGPRHRRPEARLPRGRALPRAGDPPRAAEPAVGRARRRGDAAVHGPVDGARPRGGGAPAHHHRPLAPARARPREPGRRPARHPGPALARALAGPGEAPVHLERG
ncbi:MAG: hypothetical protein AVDCRST_MAG64-3555, partial [uncultured Phycisphaerae bacterium]